jgi:hypothetical protein
MIIAETASLDKLNFREHGWQNTLFHCKNLWYNHHDVMIICDFSRFSPALRAEPKSMAAKAFPVT